MKPADHYSESHWRNVAAPIIRKVIEGHPGAEESVIRAALRDAYPFGEYRYHPYKIWLSEISVQLGHMEPIGTRTVGSLRLRARPEPDPRQEDLFR